MVEEAEEVTEAGEATGGESVVEGGEGEAEEISVNVVLLETMLERLKIIEQLAKGELKPEEAAAKLATIKAPEVEKRRRRRR